MPAGGMAGGDGSARSVAEELVAVLGSHIIRGQREIQIQAGVELVLRAATRYEVVRECRLSAQARPDFLVDGRVVVEVKMRAAGSEVLWQLGRYAAHERVEAIVVVSPRFSTLSRIPPVIHGVAVRVVGLAGAGLR